MKLRHATASTKATSTSVSARAAVGRQIPPRSKNTPTSRRAVLAIDYAASRAWTSDRSVLKSIGFVRNPSAPRSNATLRVFSSP